MVLVTKDVCRVADGTPTSTLICWPMVLAMTSKPTYAPTRRSLIGPVNVRDVNVCGVMETSAVGSSGDV